MSNTKLLEEFGSMPITPELIKRIEDVTGQPAHPFLRRGLFFSHRDLEEILDDHAAGRPIYLYTGRGPSAGSFHLGHLVPFLFTVYLQQLFDAHVVIQITDDEKFTHRDCTMEEIEVNTKENIRDIIACGFNPEKTFIFTNFDYIGTMYKNVVQIQSKLTNSQVFATFGIEMCDNIGKTSFCAIQAAPSFPSSFPHLFKSSDRRRCLIPCGIDQDPYFRLTRDVAPKLGYNKPALIHSNFVPSLQGVDTKMSSSQPQTAIFVTDTPKQIKKKINSAFSGGGDDKEAQLENGANLAVDIPFLFLTYFLTDDAELEQIREAYGSESDVKPKMFTGVVKKRAIEVITKVILAHQERKVIITSELVVQYLTTAPGLVSQHSFRLQLCSNDVPVTADNDKVVEQRRLLVLGG